LSISYCVSFLLFFLVKTIPHSLLNIPYAFYFISLSFYHLREPFVVPVPVPQFIKYPAPLTSVKYINMSTAPAAFLEISCSLPHCLAVLTLVHSSLHWRTFDDTIFRGLYQLHSLSSVSARSRHYTIHTPSLAYPFYKICRTPPSLACPFYKICRTPPSQHPSFAPLENLSRFQFKYCLLMISCRPFGVFIATHNTLPAHSSLPMVHIPYTNFVLMYNPLPLPYYAPCIWCTQTADVCTYNAYLCHSKTNSTAVTTCKFWSVQNCKWQLKANVHAEHYHLSKHAVYTSINKHRFYP
jgi:hypothetical protein